jgi:hypothetical protein
VFDLGRMSGTQPVDHRKNSDRHSARKRPADPL